MSSETIALIAILVAAASEIIALNPKLKSNSVVQLNLPACSLHSLKRNDSAVRQEVG